MITQPELGDFALVRTNDIGGRLIRIGTDSFFNHALLYVGNGNVIEARPSGAGYNTVDAYSREDYYLTWSTGAWPLTDEQRKDIVLWSVAHVGTPYSWLDIAALSAKTFHVKFPGLDKRITRSDRLICSQLVDQAWEAAGVHLFDDGRLSQDVTPGDLWKLLLHKTTYDSLNS